MANPTVWILWTKRFPKGIDNVLSKSRDLTIVHPSAAFKLVLTQLMPLGDPVVEIAKNKVTKSFQSHVILTSWKQSILQISRNLNSVSVQIL